MGKTGYCCVWVRLVLLVHLVVLGETVTQQSSNSWQTDQKNGIYGKKIKSNEQSINTNLFDQRYVGNSFSSNNPFEEMIVMDNKSEYDYHRKLDETAVPVMEPTIITPVMEPTQQPPSFEPSGQPSGVRQTNLSSLNSINFLNNQLLFCSSITPKVHFLLVFCARFVSCVQCIPLIDFHFPSSIISNLQRYQRRVHQLSHLCNPLDSLQTSLPVNPRHIHLLSHQVNPPNNLRCNLRINPASSRLHCRRLNQLYSQASNLRCSHPASLACNQPHSRRCFLLLNLHHNLLNSHQVVLQCNQVLSLASNPLICLRCNQVHNRLSSRVCVHLLNPLLSRVNRSFSSPSSHPSFVCSFYSPTHNKKTPSLA